MCVCVCVCVCVCEESQPMIVIYKISPEDRPRETKRSGL